MKEEPPAKPRRLRLGKLHWWILALFLAVCGYQAWRVYDYQAAVREAKEAGLEWQSTDPFDLIRQDWRAALRKETWATHERTLRIGELFTYHPRGFDLGPYRELIHRLRPTNLRIYQCGNLDALKGLSSLKQLSLQFCPALQNLEPLKGLTGLQSLNLSGCPTLQNLDALKELTGLESIVFRNCAGLKNLDALKSLTGLQNLVLEDCPALENVDALKNLTGLGGLGLINCQSLQNFDALKTLTGLRGLDLGSSKNIPSSTVRELRAALPNTDINIQEDFQTLE